MTISVVIPVYKKIDQFIDNLSINIKYLSGNEIIVVNDDPTESIAKYLSDFPQVILIENKKNLGFGPTVNVGFEQVNNPYVLLLNSDVVLKDDSYKKALLRFKDKTVFAVSFAQEEKNGEIVGKNRIYWDKGFLQHSKAKDLTDGINAWAEGGSCMIDTNKFRALLGFDKIYSPFYWEDIDLSYRAWKYGYQIFFDPKIVVHHHHETTISNFFMKKVIKRIAYRNQLLFIWKNISDSKLMSSHTFYLILIILKSILKGDITFLKGYIQALGKLPSLLQKRKEIDAIRTDNEIFSKFL